MKHCAYLSMDSLDGFFSYDRLTFEPLQALGWQVEEVSWRNESADWNQYDAVVIRTTWDYQDDPPAFMKVLEQIESSEAQLHNSLELVRWNLSKTYLKELEEKGIAIVPTLWDQKFSPENFRGWAKSLEKQELIVKPVISANADFTYRLAVNTSDVELEKIAPDFQQRPFMVQPFMKSIVEEGEYSLFFFGGNYSHTVLKRPKRQDFRVQEEHGGKIEAVEAHEKLLNTACQVMEAITPQPLYARVDLINNQYDEYVLIEVELIEPSLYFEYCKKSPGLFAQALDASTH
ncbi:glutathione synthase/RimK-type ligase-like ATP-grasp enzyme [Catalinimonas alkaloidigena]|uniref:ATP-grasp domain-containing protein n=1 Tax=Catalinimonas alkaloidigena TaxID=1075417 RepID=UPI002405821F|nr:hypothetical protein [Catalinimonas alkaloidigena]MDF9798674.1 glutathione synthase/RimK-type ligase-like ATP-grasp enzyme [Catalinimonas alkaloidigena]